MITITKKEKEYLELQGCTFPEDLHRHGKGKQKTYYATESSKIRYLLKQYQEKIKC